MNSETKLMPEITIFEGEELSGKTTSLAQEAAALLAGCASADDILVVTANVQGEAAFAAALNEAAASTGLPQGISPRIVNVRALELGVIAEAAAAGVVERDARLMMPCEEAMLLDDLKTSGIPPKRLKGMISFLFRSWTELADDDPLWPPFEEERTVHKLMGECLDFMRIIHPAELSKLALKCLRLSERIIQKQGAAYVLVDDFTLLNRASQKLVLTLAGKRVFIAANGADHLPEALDPYPYAKGLEELEQARPDLNIYRLERRLRADSKTLIASTIQDEAESVAAAVKGSIEEGLAPASIFVACPNRMWSGRMARALAAADIPVRGIPDAEAALRDERLAKACALLMIAANEADGGAWRSWCGIGAHLSNGSAMRLMRTECGCALPQALESIEDLVEGVEGLPGTQRELLRVKEAYERGLALAGRARSLRGRELIVFIAGECCEEEEQAALISRSLQALCDPHPDDDVEDLARTITRRVHFPAVSKADAVIVATYDQSPGFSPDVVIATGAVGGFFPRSECYDEAGRTIEQRERAKGRDRALLESARKRARKLVVTTSFAECPLESAEQLNLKIRRVRSVKGRRMALIEQTPFITQ